MGTAKVISMTAQPLHVSYLCFETGGILDTRHAELGVAVKDIPFQKLTGQLKMPKTIPGDPSRFQFDSQRIMTLLKQFALATLRNEEKKAILDSAVNSRQNIYFSKYANSASVISTIKGYYSKTSPTSKANRLEILSEIAQQQAMDLQQAYTEDDRMGVVKATSSCIESRTESNGTATRGGKFHQESVARYAGKGTKLPHVPPVPWEGISEVSGELVWQGMGYESARFTAPNTTQIAQTVGVNFEESMNKGSARGTQSALHVDFEYRTPYLEARARNNRAQISLMDQKFEAYMFEQNMPHMEKIFENELNSIDNDVYQLQIGLLRTFLMSPIPGIVTGIYKNPGDAVNAGEPVIRVEDHGVVRLVATLVHHGPISIGATATVTTTLNGASSPATTFTGSVVAARGQGDCGRWEVVAQVNNVDAGGNYILPLGYSFDREYTDVNIV